MKEKGKITSFKEWANMWLKVYKHRKVGYGTYKNYRFYLEKYIIPKFDTENLDEVLPYQIEQLLSDCSELSSSALRHIKIIINAIYETAIDNGLCDENPCKLIKVSTKQGMKINYFVESQIKEIMKYAPAHEYGYYVLILLYTGMRTGELLALKWTDIDLNTKIIHISRSIKKNLGGPIEGTTKSGRDRYVGIPDYLCDILLALLESRELDNDYVIASPRGAYLSHSTFLLRYRQVFEYVNSLSPVDIEYLSPHKCRHTYVTYLLRCGANIRAVQQAVGHSTITTTQLYAHVDLKDVVLTANKLHY